jgi:REP element-mobilizing transposase RayT
MDNYLPPGPASFSLKPVVNKDVSNDLPPKDWPHAPVHRLSENGIYFVTAGTLYKKHLFDTPAKLDQLERTLLSLAKKCAWQLEAWAVLVNHYHIVARGAPDSAPMQDFLRELHSRRRLTSIAQTGFKTGRYGITSETPGSRTNTPIWRD